MYLSYSRKPSQKKIIQKTVKIASWSTCKPIF